MKNLFIFCLALSVSTSIAASTVPASGEEFEGLRFRESVTCTIIPPSSEPWHKYYVSVSNVKYNAKVGALQMTTHFFIDDLQEVLRQRYDEKLILGETPPDKALNALLSRYLARTLEMKAGGKKLVANLLGSEYDGDQIVLYTELAVATRPTSITARFSALNEVFDTQKNLIHYHIASRRRTMILERESPADTVNF